MQKSWLHFRFGTMKLVPRRKVRFSVFSDFMQVESNPGGD
ncbi:MAG: hypothetical protein UZ02_AOB001000048 [Nitrosomonas europaea]|mgnify:CR=1 FL=1|nr:MAG: hypothetical protein UZ02_AOB001000048 [Nitrosomonas europaea]